MRSLLRSLWSPRRHDNGNVVCILKVNSTLIFGENDKKKTSPHWYKDHDNNGEKWTRHAEEHAIQLFMKKFEHKFHKIKKVYVVRYKKDGSLAMARPCKYCQRKFKKHGINPRIIFYSNEQGEIENLKIYDNTK